MMSIRRHKRIVRPKLNYLALNILYSAKEAPIYAFSYYQHKIYRLQKTLNSFRINQRIFFKKSMLKLYWTRLIYKSFYKYSVLKHLTVYNENNKETLPKTLYFLNLKKPVFGKVKVMRQVYWALNSNQRLSKRRYLRWLTNTLKHKTFNILNFSGLFYILRHLELILSWAHLFLLLKFRLVTVNQKAISQAYKLSVGDIIECWYGESIYFFKLYLATLGKKYIKRIKQWAYTRYLCSQTKQTYKGSQLPKVLKQIPYCNTPNINFCSFDYLLNCVAVVRTPEITMFMHPSKYYSNVFFYFTKWKY